MTEAMLSYMRRYIRRRIVERWLLNASTALGVILVLVGSLGGSLWPAVVGAIVLAPGAVIDRRAARQREARRPVAADE